MARNNIDWRTGKPVADDQGLDASSLCDIELERSRSLPVFGEFLKDPRPKLGMTDEHKECLRRAHFWRRKPTVDSYFATLKMILELESGEGDFEVLTPDEEDEPARRFREHMEKKTGKPWPPRRRTIVLTNEMSFVAPGPRNSSGA